jgi:hypothetical protein
MADSLGFPEVPLSEEDLPQLDPETVSGEINRRIADLGR